MPTRPAPLAIAYDFDGTLAPGNMQERDFIPAIGMTTKTFWDEVRSQCQKHEADNILMYMRQMLAKAEAQQVQVRKENFAEFGAQIPLFEGVVDWFDRLNIYAKAGGISLEHFIISSGIREMVLGTPIASKFKAVYASSFLYDHHGVACWPALALNYTTKTQYLFRINKGSLHVFDHSKINQYVPNDERPVPFQNMIFIGDGETDIPCFRLVKDQGGNSIAVYRPYTGKGKKTALRLQQEGRVNFVAPADYRDGKDLDRIVKAIMDKIASEWHLKNLRRTK